MTNYPLEVRLARMSVNDENGQDQESKVSSTQRRILKPPEN
jgi:hypothetical protein